MVDPISFETFSFHSIYFLVWIGQKCKYFNLTFKIDDRLLYIQNQ